MSKLIVCFIFLLSSQSITDDWSHKRNTRKTKAVQKKSLIPHVSLSKLYGKKKIHK